MSACTSGRAIPELDRQPGTPCGRELVELPDPKTGRSAFVCPKCDGIKPRE